MGNVDLVNQLVQLKSLIARLQILLLEAVCVIKIKNTNCTTCGCSLLNSVEKKKENKKKTKSTTIVVIKFPCTPLV